MPTQQDYEDKGIPDKEIFDRLVARQDEMPRRHCAVHNREEFKYEALEHELRAATPPTSPSAAAMRAAEELKSLGLLWNAEAAVELGGEPFDGNEQIERVAAIITRCLAGTPVVAIPNAIAVVEKMAHEYKDDKRVTEPINVITAVRDRLLDLAATPSPETAVGGEVSYDQIVQAITDVERARESHAQWANHLRLPHTFECQGCVDHASHIGDAEYHDEWIAKYDNVINVLFSINPFKGTTPAKEKRP